MDHEVMTEKKQGFLARRAKGVASYVGRRFGNAFINEVGRDTLKKSAAGAKDAMRPANLDMGEFRKGLDGRYADGGVARFAEVMREKGLTASELPRLKRDHRLAAIFLFSAGAGFLFFGCSIMFGATSFKEFMIGLSSAFVSLVLAAIGVAHDFARWQIECRRFGGFREYLNGATGRRGDSQGKAGGGHA